MHPRVTRWSQGMLWHLEDSKLPKYDAGVLARHLRNTEGKKARVAKTKEGYQVWWAK